MKLSSFLLFLAVLTTGIEFAQAQMGLEGFSSGRYEVRKVKSRSPASAGESTPVVTDSEGVAVRTHKKSETEKPAVTEAAEAPSVSSSTTKITPQEPVTPAEEPGLSEQAESLFSSGTSRIQDFYREQIHPDDIRNNRLEIDIMPVLVYNDSQSNYSYRDYHSYFNGFKFGANVWLTPLIGVSGRLMFSLAADLDPVAGVAARVPAKYEVLDLGVNFRTFFGVSRKASSLELSLLLSDSKMTTPSNNVSRASVKSQGLGVGLKARIPTSGIYAWTVGGSFFPRLQHSESDAGIAVDSGSVVENVRLGLDFGGEWKFSRESQMLWNLGVSSERNIFDGAAGLPDPSTGVVAENVSVTNSLYIFSLGYRWGH